MIDHLATELGLGLAERTARRDPTSLLVNGVLAAGRGLVIAFAGGGATFAGAAGLGACRHEHSVGCFGERYCRRGEHGDNLGCNIAGRHSLPGGGVHPGVPGADIHQCITCNTSPGSTNPCVGSTPNIEKWWACCCDGRRTVCVDCVSRPWPIGPASRRRCICEYFAGRC